MNIKNEPENCTVRLPDTQYYGNLRNEPDLNGAENVQEMRVTNETEPNIRNNKSFAEKLYVRTDKYD